MATVSMFLPNLSGTVGLTLFLRKSSDYSLLNAGGDAMTESGTSGWFAATVVEVWTETLSATVIDGDGLVPAAGWLTVGSLIVADSTAVLDYVTLAALTANILLIDDIASYCLTILCGATSTAGTANESYVRALNGETFTVAYTGLDATGNRTTTTLSKV